MTRTLAAVVTLATLGALAGTIEAQVKPSRGATKDPRILAYDKGKDTINVSKYPPEMKAAYRVFENRCGACHTLARAINSDYVLEDEWQGYIRQMMDKSGGLIDADEAARIYEFLMHDSKTRKKDLYEKKKAAS
jgi:hypothetical protein